MLSRWRLLLRRPSLRECAIFLAFLALTVLMTWPWAAQLRDALSDRGDPYLNAWILWWDYHQTFRDPLRLFHSNTFYPYQYTLAFSEHNYGLALPLFPLFALGVRPLTIHGVATLLGFTLCGYGMFRLARTLTGSSGVAWVAGIAFAFVPYRFDHLPHVNYIFAGWIPLLFEALVLFARRRSWPRAVWLGVAFLMNALTCIHWFVLTLIPLAAVAAILLTRRRAWMDRAFWFRSAVTLGLAGLLLLPFLLPYARVAELYKFTRDSGEVASFSATPLHWLVAPGSNKLWQGFGAQLTPETAERSLFPGLLLMLLALAALLWTNPPARLRVERLEVRLPPRRLLLLCLDALAIGLLISAIYVTGYGEFRLKLFGANLLTSHDPARPLLLLMLVLLARCCIAYPAAFRSYGARNLIDTIHSRRRSEAFWLGVVLALIGFCGSLGMNFFFHRALFQTVKLFQSIRVPARWAMLCYVGLALLAGLGARQCARRLAGRRRTKLFRPAIIYTIIAAALLFEFRAAPLALVRGEADPDALTLRLKETPMRGGLVELPVGESFRASEDGKNDYYTNAYYVLRAADHARPLVTAYSGFMPPIAQEIETLTRARPIPPRLLDLLESIPASYLTVHNFFLTPESRRALEAFLQGGLATGRLRFIRSYGTDEHTRQDLYAITKTEPEAASEAALPLFFPPQATAQDVRYYENPIDESHFFVRQQYLDLLGREPRVEELNAGVLLIEACLNDQRCRHERRASVPAMLLRSDEFRETAFFIYRLYTIGLGRMPSYAEFAADAQTLNSSSAKDKLSFADEWVRRTEFSVRYSSQLSNAEFIEQLLHTAQASLPATEHTAIVRRLDRAPMSRAQMLIDVVDHPAIIRQQDDRAYVALQYFSFVRRAADEAGMQSWLRASDKDAPDDPTIVNGFITSLEYRARFARR